MQTTRKIRVRDADLANTLETRKKHHRTIDSLYSQNLVTLPRTRIRSGDSAIRSSASSRVTVTQFTDLPKMALSPRTPQRRTKCIDAEMGALSTTNGRVIPAIKRRLLNQKSEIEAILLMGSTASKSEFRDWDDFDVQVYTRSKPARDSYYEILNDSGKHYLLSVYYCQLDLTSHPMRNVTEQKDVQVLFGRKESLRHIFVDRPRRVEPLRYELREFDTRYERYFEILVDIFFILNRYEAKGKANSTKPRVARDGLRTLSRHFFEFYGVNLPIPKRARWKDLLSEVDSLLNERGFASKCKNAKFAKAAIELMRSTVPN